MPIKKRDPQTVIRENGGNQLWKLYLLLQSDSSGDRLNGKDESDGSDFQAFKKVEPVSHYCSVLFEHSPAPRQ